eukprot:Rhum_TRINITY_DN8740_c0_g1::Rhum_TRINITY_DN8740_c0_g1_i1::g.29429::m.29429/K03667/hslU; ATP-dependent HslUV protease ATP-binding subunit HslU
MQLQRSCTAAAVAARQLFGRQAQTQLRYSSASAAAATPSAPSPVQLDEEAWDLEKKIMERALTPADTVVELNKYIIGQEAAKRAVAISLRNRWRRVHVSDKDLKEDIQPKNILMVGPTGVGKTEISRRMARLTDAPFVKVEATKFTEVGFKGRDVDTIVEDLYQMSVQKARSLARGRNQKQARENAIQIILSKTVPDQTDMHDKYRTMLLNGDLDDREIEYTLAAQQQQQPHKHAAMLDPDVRQHLQQNVLVLGRTRKMQGTIKEAFPLIEKDELEKLIDDKQIGAEAQHLAERHGIVFIDEIDKVVTPARDKRMDSSAEGVQQDLLPLVEGCVVTLKDGVTINTQNVLFICSGAFHNSKPSDMIAELQGRLPVRVELSNLTEHDFYRILTEPVYNIIRQNVELLKTEGASLKFTDGALKEIASLTKQLNENLQNIGARRLTTIVEKIVEDISFEAEDYAGKTVTIEADYVTKKIKELKDKTSDPLKSIL